jgi:hypothetical protein
MGLGLAATTGSLIVVTASILAGIIWWLGTQSELLSQRETQRNQILARNPILPEVTLGVAMLLMVLLIFSIRSA